MHKMGCASRIGDACNCPEHDDRCEADWNDGICACSERAEPRLVLHRPPRVSLTRRLLTRLRIY